MRRLRRRLLLALPIALVLALTGGSSVSESMLSLRSRSESLLPKTSLSQDFGLAPINPVAATGMASDVATLNSVPAPVPAEMKTAPTRFSGAAPRRTAPPAAINDGGVASQGTQQSGTWAVVIGVNDYPGTADDLRSAVNDADDVHQALRAFGVAGDRVLYLRDGQVTSNTILKSVAWLANHAGPNAVAGFFFAGHVRKTPNGNEEMVGSDGSAVTDVELARALDRVQAGRSWVAIAACFGLGFDEVLRPGRVLTAAAARNAVAYENSSLNRSYMVEYMVRQAMLQGRASQTIQTAFSYAVNRIAAEHPGREPVQIDYGDGALDLRPPGAERSQPQPASPEPTPTTPPPSAPPTTSGNTGQNCHTRGLIRYCTNK